MSQQMPEVGGPPSYTADATMPVASAAHTRRALAVLVADDLTRLKNSGSRIPEIAPALAAAKAVTRESGREMRAQAAGESPGLVSRLGQRLSSTSISPAEADRQLGALPRETVAVQARDILRDPNLGKLWQDGKLTQVNRHIGEPAPRYTGPSNEMLVSQGRDPYSSVMAQGLLEPWEAAEMMRERAQRNPATAGAQVTSVNAPRNGRRGVARDQPSNPAPPARGHQPGL
ncbi:hypothetical protein [Actinoplanes sp. NPDC051851]|uniref:hypothetical protein n=1 Tax=Actinoplanes sp. NPDC051851 TaxID=3154753 RepID=UPI00344A175B